MYTLIIIILLYTSPPLGKISSESIVIPGFSSIHSCIAAGKKAMKNITAVDVDPYCMKVE